MKKTNFVFKGKGLAVLLILTIGISGTGLCAEEIFCNEKYINIERSFENEKAGNAVTVSVVESGTDIVEEWETVSPEDFSYYDEIILTDDLTARVNFVLNENGCYTAYISSKTTGTEEVKIVFIDKVSFDETLTELRVAVSEGKELTKVFLSNAENRKALGLFSNIFEGADFDKTSALLVENGINENEQESVRRVIEEAMLIELAEKGKLKDIKKYDNLSVEDEGIYKWINDSVVNELNGGEYSSLSAFEEIVLEKAALYYSNKNNDQTKLKEFLEDFHEELGIKLTKITTSACREVIKKGNFTSAKGEHEKAIAYFVNNYSQSGGGSSGGGSSSGGGGSSGSSMLNSYQGTQIVIEPVKTVTEEVSFFSDIDGVEWAKEEIGELYKRGVIKGKTENNFAPYDKVTREEFVKMLVAAFDMTLVDEEIYFEDVAETDWSYEYIRSAYSAGIIKGISESLFGKTQEVTRQDICVMLYRMLSVAETEIKANNAVKDFADGEKIASYAKDAVEIIQALGIVEGDENGYFNPTSPATRAEAAKLICNTIKYYEKAEKEGIK